MKAILNVIMVLLSMIALILEKSSCFEILVVGLLFMILFELEKFRLKNKRGDEVARYTISIDTRIETLLNNYMKENNIDLKSVAIKSVLKKLPIKKI